ncbi:hypothetical protein [uncultured Methanobacterium sp.]|uniref:hypothetical protein n=1 Tax=uncultured Methanobacterium sp. TaxID=176306 RepID=UPI002AA86AE3|nr:hypothetical protein [uncultured Methanobacterium sp.]
MNILQEYEIEDLLNDLGIEVEDSARISDGELTYFIFSVSNLEADKEEIVEKLEINKWPNGLYCSSNINYNPNEILELIKPIYMAQEQYLWEIIIKKAHLINEKHLEKTRFHLFDLNDFIVTILKWNGKIATQKSEFYDFIIDFNIIIRFSCKKEGNFTIDKKYSEHPFWGDLAIIRNSYVHAPKERGVNFAINRAKREKKAFKNLIDKESPDPNLPFDFIKSQINLLENCIEFLDNMLEDYG